MFGHSQARIPRVERFVVFIRSWMHCLGSSRAVEFGLASSRSLSTVADAATTFALKFSYSAYVWWFHSESESERVSVVALLGSDSSFLGIFTTTLAWSRVFILGFTGRVTGFRCIGLCVRLLVTSYSGLAPGGVESNATGFELGWDFCRAIIGVSAPVGCVFWRFVESRCCFEPTEIPAQTFIIGLRLVVS